MKEKRKQAFEELRNSNLWNNVLENRFKEISDILELEFMIGYFWCLYHQDIITLEVLNLIIDFLYDERQLLKQLG